MTVNPFSVPGCEAFCICYARLPTMTVNPFSGPGCKAFCVSEVRLIMIIVNPFSGPDYDAYSVSDVRLLTMALWSVSGPGVAAECTPDEIRQLISCIAANNSQVFNVSGNNTTTCNRSQMSSDICG